ncbi:hypothetical protein GCM10010285_22970 [Streptomyces pseudogriseolus]|uniref:Uncharacterized protein n=1 Tax=Streptomyces pseudogriseolus TaxID=36817 RepID=A0ABQ2SXR2_STREZ|nr:hypothetical protein GCM10010285_22970 [Streptomyces rubiginosus]
MRVSHLRRSRRFGNRRWLWGGACGEAVPVRGAVPAEAVPVRGAVPPDRVLPPRVGRCLEIGRCLQA